MSPSSILLPGQSVLLPAVILSIAAILSVTTLVTCPFVVSKDSSHYELGLWPSCFKAPEYGKYGNGAHYDYSEFVNDPTRKFSAACGVIACSVGTGAAIAVWVMTCKKYSTKYIVVLSIAISLAFGFQLATLAMFQTRNCVPDGCILSTSAILSVSAACLWFVSFICLVVIFQPWIKINLVGKTKQDRPLEAVDQELGNEVEEMDAEIENAPSSNIVTSTDRMEYAVEDDDNLAEHES